MAVTRQANLLSQGRLDIPHIRAIESSVAGDFDILAGRGMAGGAPLVLRGFEVTGIAAGTTVTTLQMTVANGIVFNQQATESGTFLWVPSNRAPESLNPNSNGKIIGGWVNGATNYVGIDFVRSADSTTTDVVQFVDPATGLETPKSVPLAATLDYTIQISTIPFSSQPNIIPVAIVQVSTTGTVTSISDARPLMFRLGSGGDAPSRQNFLTKWTRSEGFSTTDNTLFTGGDKTLQSLKDWQDAVMTRIWESSGGEYWYSQTADRNVTLLTFGTPTTNGDYFNFNAGTGVLSWQNLRLVFDNSTAYSADLAAGSATILPGQVLYVDLDRSRYFAPIISNGTAYVLGDIGITVDSGVGHAWECTVAGTSAGGPTYVAGMALGTDATDGGVVHWKYLGLGSTSLPAPAVADIRTLGSGFIPGARWALAWRRADKVYVRGWRYPVGTLFTPATTLVQGMVRISRLYDGTDSLALSSAADPVAISDRGGAIAIPAAYAGDGLTFTGGSNSSWGINLGTTSGQAINSSGVMQVNLPNSAAPNGSQPLLNLLGGFSSYGFYALNINTNNLKSINASGIASFSLSDVNTSVTTGNPIVDISGGYSAGTQPGLRVNSRNGLAIQSINGGTGGTNLSAFGISTNYIGLYTKTSWAASSNVANAVLGNGGLLIHSDAAGAAIPATPPYNVPDSAANCILLSGAAHGLATKNAAVQVINRTANTTPLEIQQFNGTNYAEIFAIDYTGAFTHDIHTLGLATVAGTLTVNSYITSVGNINVGGSVQCAVNVNASGNITSLGGSVTAATQFNGINAPKAWGLLTWSAGVPAPSGQYFNLAGVVGGLAITGAGLILHCPFVVPIGAGFYTTVVTNYGGPADIIYTVNSNNAGYFEVSAVRASTPGTPYNFSTGGGSIQVIVCAQ